MCFDYNLGFKGRSVPCIRHSFRVWKSSSYFLWYMYIIKVILCSFFLTSCIHCGMISLSSCTTVLACFLLRYVGWCQKPTWLRSCQNFLYNRNLFVLFVRDGLAIPTRKAGGRDTMHGPHKQCGQVGLWGPPFIVGWSPPYTVVVVCPTMYSL